MYYPKVTHQQQREYQRIAPQGWIFYFDLWDGQKDKNRPNTYFCFVGTFR